MTYFTKHSIKSITLQGDKLLIEYNNNSPTETKSINTSELKAIQSYCQAQGLTSLSLSDLQKTNTETKPTNWTPWLIGGSVVILVLIIGIISYSWIKKKQENKK